MRRRRLGLSLTPFLIVQAILVLGLGALTAYRAQLIRQDRALPPLRPLPLQVRPLYDEPVVVTDEQLLRILLRLRPRFEGSATKINCVDHALRFWGVRARFEDARFMSGEDMLRLLTDHRRFVEVYGPDAPSLLVDKERGVGYRTIEGKLSSGHTDHTPACLAEVGTPLNLPVVTPTRQTTFRAVLEQSLYEFSLNQMEYEWSAKLCALYLPPVTRWRTTETQLIDFDRIAERIMREDLPRGVCLGSHRLFTLAVFLQVDEQETILTPEGRRRIVAFLRDATAKYQAHQHPDGYWDGNWPFAVADPAVPLDERLIATGHALEMWAYLPGDLQPNRHVLAAAGQWLVRSVDSLSDEEIQDKYVYLSHVGRALACWRKKKPMDVIRGHEPPAEELPAPSSAQDAAPAGSSDSRAPKANPGPDAAEPPAEEPPS